MSKKTFFLILAIVVFLGFFAFWLWRQSMFSKEILRLEILGPDRIKLGDEIEYTIKYKNNGNFVLENPKLTFIMPDNSLTEDSKTRITKDLPDIYPGLEDVVKIKTRLLGKEGDLKTAKASLSYIPKNLTARYESKTTFTTKIETVPITLDFDLPSKIEKGKELQYSINYFSNVDYPLENLSLKINPINGFEIKSSSPASLDNSEWKLQTLNKAQGGRIIISGTANAPANQTLTFSAQLGMRQDGGFAVIKEANADVQVIQPLLFISQQVNGSSNYVATPGETLRYQISFTNIGSSAFDNLFAIVRLAGSALDTATIQPEGGQIQPNDNMIVFDLSRSPQLKHLEPQQSGQIYFNVKVKNDWTPNSSDPNSSIITDEINISHITQKFTIKVNSGLVISQKAYYQSSDIPNSGPVPPAVGKATTYTIVWNIQNYSSDEKNVKVKATLPQNVNLTGKIMPENEHNNFTFDSKSREIVWSVGDILAGTGVNGDPILLAFQISLTPSASQKGATAQLIGPVQISGENQFTNTTITATDSAVTTALPDDFSHSGGGIIQ